MGKLFGDVCDRVGLKNGVVLGGYRVKSDFKTMDGITACLNDGKNHLVKRGQQWSIAGAKPFEEGEAQNYFCSSEMCKTRSSADIEVEEEVWKIEEGEKMWNRCLRERASDPMREMC